MDCIVQVSRIPGGGGKYPESESERLLVARFPNIFLPFF
jgi:hypothetical protein